MGPINNGRDFYVHTTRKHCYVFTHSVLPSSIHKHRKTIRSFFSYFGAYLFCRPRPAVYRPWKTKMKNIYEEEIEVYTAYIKWLQDEDASSIMHTVIIVTGIMASVFLVAIYCAARYFILN